MELAKLIRNINEKEALESYQDLKKADCEKYPGLGRAGLKALDYLFFQHRIKAKTKNLSFYEAMHDSKIIKHLDNLILKYKKLDTEKLSIGDLQKNRYSVFQLYYGSVNQFRPIVAKWVYCMLKPKIGVLDFSAGWGGRCLAAISLNIPYIGIDTNTNLEKSYYDMLGMFEPDAKGKMIFKQSEHVDFSKFKYDLCFTSPPYFKIEKYEKMPNYPTKQDFLDKFFIPVVLKAWKYLTYNGHLALNMPEEMYNALKNKLPPISKILKLPLANKHSKAAQKGENGDKIKNHSHYEEYIYVWKKHNRKTKRISQRKCQSVTKKSI